MYHFFDARCGCSQSIISNLLKRKPFKEKTVEIVFYQGNLGKYYKPLLDKGYNLKEMSFEKIGVTGVPLLVIFNNRKEVQYAGGYSNKSINPLAPPNEISLISKIRKGEDITTMPVIGCSVSKKYQKLLDPLGLKYESTIN